MSPSMNKAAPRKAGSDLTSCLFRAMPNSSEKLGKSKDEEKEEVHAEYNLGDEIEYNENDER